MSRKPPSIKAIQWDALMALSVDDIVALFPHGADATSSGKWLPAGKTRGEKHSTLKNLLSEKRKRQEDDRYLGKTGGYTTNPAYALYTTPEVGVAIPKAVQDRYSEEGWENTQDRRNAVPLSDQLRDIEDHLRPDQRAELRRRIEGMKRSTLKQAA